MKILKISFLFTLLTLFGCPCEDCGSFEQDTPVFLINNNFSTVKLISLPTLRENEADSLLSLSEINFVYDNLENEDRQISLENGQKKEILRISSKGLKYMQKGEYYFLFNVDTINSIPKEDFDQVRGVKKYFLKTWEDYEAINFTLEYP